MTTIKNVQHLINKYKKHNRMKWFSVRRNGTHGVHKGKSTNTANFANVHINKIIDIVIFGLKKMFFHSRN